MDISDAYALCKPPLTPPEEGGLSKRNKKQKYYEYIKHTREV